MQRGHRQRRPLKTCQRRPWGVSGRSSRRTGQASARPPSSTAATFDEPIKPIVRRASSSAAACHVSSPQAARAMRSCPAFAASSPLSWPQPRGTRPLAEGLGRVLRPAVGVQHGAAPVADAGAGVPSGSRRQRAPGAALRRVRARLTVCSAWRYQTLGEAARRRLDVRRVSCGMITRAQLGLAAFTLGLAAAIAALVIVIVSNSDSDDEPDPPGLSRDLTAAAGASPTPEP